MTQKGLSLSNTQAEKNVCYDEYTTISQQAHLILLLVFCLMMRSWHLTKFQYELLTHPNLLLLKYEMLLKVGHTGINISLEICYF